MAHRKFNFQYFNNTHRFRGYHSGDAAITSPQERDVYLRWTDGQWRIYGSGGTWSDFVMTSINIDGTQRQYLGWFSTEDLARHAINQGESFIAFDRENTQERRGVYLIDNYVSAPLHIYFWAPITYSLHEATGIVANTDYTTLYVDKDDQDRNKGNLKYRQHRDGALWLTTRASRDPDDNGCCHWIREQRRYMGRQS